MDSIVRDALSVKYLEIEELHKQIAQISKNPGNVSVLLSQIQQIKKDIKRLIKEERKNVEKVYMLISHETFLNRILKFVDNQFIPGEQIGILSKPNGLLIIDEIQNLVSAIGTNYRKLLFAIRFFTNKKFRVVLLTGTPIYDKPFEFGLLMNLLRPRITFPDGRDQFNEVFINETVTNVNGVFIRKQEMINKELFKQMCSGYVSYFKGGNPEAYPYKKTIIMHHSMNPYQYNIYKAALIKEVENDQKNMKKDEDNFMVRVISSEKKNDEVASSGIFNNSNLFCNIAFPEVKLSAEELERLSKQTILENGIKELKKVLTAQNIKDTSLPENEQINGILKLTSIFSSKFAKVAELILLSEGPVFVYSNYVWYGVNAMATIMDGLGYREYPLKGTRGSYFIWSGKANPELIPKAKKLFNNSNNKDGSLLKIMFGTQTVMEGVDFKNVRQVHILDPWWNDSRLQQVIARAIRLCSHKELPVNQRIVDVFIHLSTLGSAETMYEMKIKSVDRDNKPIEKKVKSLLILQNPDQKDAKQWVFKEAYIKLDKESNATISDLFQTFLANQILPDTIIKLADPSLTRSFGHHKKLDSISVQEYMYNKALTKLNINRQFELAIKETAIDCTLNRYGNIVRLEEMYTPFPGILNTFELNYLNYQTGEIYKRHGIKSRFNPSLQENVLDIRDILENTAKKSSSFKFTDSTGKDIVLRSFLMNENIDCKITNYAFDIKIPPQIIQWTLNKELISILMKKPVKELQEFLYLVESHEIQTDTKDIARKINKFISKDASIEKQRIIATFIKYGVGDEQMWQLYPLDKLKEEYRKFNFKLLVDEDFVNDYI